MDYVNHLSQGTRQYKDVFCVSKAMVAHPRIHPVLQEFNCSSQHIFYHKGPQHQSLVVNDFWHTQQVVFIWVTQEMENINKT